MFIQDGNDPRYQYVPARSMDNYTLTLPPGVYNAAASPFSGLRFETHEMLTERYVPLRNDTARRVGAEVDRFFDPEVEARVIATGSNHKRGILIYGDPGTGKSSL